MAPRSKTVGPVAKLPRSKAVAQPTPQSGSSRANDKTDKSSRPFRRNFRDPGNVSKGR